ncbi:GNAT family N-acetyltransferase [Chitinophaga japonensis]|uniref:RimJ/RimL family protein N-acetyltransferase n=1 Tax=Chitinophaga japonensis TaxID=104662 RepID=A0A562SLX2_CHIJA|nr:GNAT family protein [Chitinophaga japonensis]TWI82093.1 RimJ/RimL family protein N-acetyltransferase [Chitinophaga japonensis]
MDFYPVLENKRVLLRPLQAADIEGLLPVALQPVLWKVSTIKVQEKADLEKYVQTALADRERGEAIPFVIIDRRENRVAGSTRFAAISQSHRRAEIGYTWIDPPLQGSGLNKAMKFAMLQHAFEVMGLNRVELKTNELNTRSRNAILSIGAQQEGILRHHMVGSDGSLRNTVYFSILKAEWPEIKERIFAKYGF